MEATKDFSLLQSICGRLKAMQEAYEYKVKNGLERFPEKQTKKLSKTVWKSFSKHIKGDPTNGRVRTPGVIKALDVGKDGVLQSGAGIETTQMAEMRKQDSEYLQKIKKQNEKSIGLLKAKNH